MFDIIVIFVVILCVFVSFMRGALKELFGLMGMFLSILLTINHFDFFKTNYMSMKYIESEFVANILSTISVFVIITTAIVIVNSWIMYVLSPIRLGVVDRLSGIFIGVLKGILFSSILFFIIEIYYFTFYTKNESENSDVENILPDWLTDSHSYPLFYTIENNLNKYIPQPLYDKVKKLGHNLNDIVSKKLQNEEKQEDSKQKNKSNKQVHKKDK